MIQNTRFEFLKLPDLITKIVCKVKHKVKYTTDWKKAFVTYNSGFNVFNKILNRRKNIINIDNNVNRQFMEEKYK